MRLVALVLLIALALGALAGGRLGGLVKLRTRWTFLAIAGLALQVLPPAGWWPMGLLTFSFVLLSVFCAVNLRTPGFALILAGTLMNFLVIGINRGMPVDRGALVASGQEDTLSDLTRNGGTKHHLAGPDNRLMFLADVMAIPPPFRQAVSGGDVVAYAGVGYLVVAAMRRDRRGAVPLPVFSAEAMGDG
jgi:uncharacterized protein DUF5317